MTKPDDIPQNVWEAAWQVVRDSWESGKGAEITARAIMAAQQGHLPKLENVGRFLAEDNTGQWHYINHAGAWQGCPPPFPSVADEREACARIAEDCRIDPEVDHVGLVDGANRACVKVARAIRKRGEA